MAILSAVNPLSTASASTSDTAQARNTLPPEEMLKALRAAQRPIVFGHIAPDADCLGAALGLVQTLREHGSDAVLGLPESGVSRRLRFMLELAPHSPKTAMLPGDRDALIVVDTASEKRVNFEPRPSFSDTLASLNIDHHITNTDYCRINWVDPHASSTCELVARLIGALGWTPSSAAASLLYAGLHGDTAGFSLPSTSAEALSTAADLVRAGADVTHIGEQLCRSQGRHDFELLRRVYDHTAVVADGRIAYSFLTHADIVASHCGPQDIDDQVSIPRALAGVRVAILFSEGEPGMIRVNLRGEGHTHVLPIAERFGGGGHTQSAGIRLRNKSMQQVISEVVAAAEAHLRDGPT